MRRFTVPFTGATETAQPEVEPASSPMGVESTGWQHVTLKFLLVTMLIQTFVILREPKGLTITNVVILLLAGIDVLRGALRRLPVNPFLMIAVFITVFFAWQSLSQLLNAIVHPHLTQLDPNTLVSNESPISSLLRSSTFTQSAYLVVSVLFFSYIVQLLRVRNNAAELIRFARLGVIIFVAWGFAEWIAYAVAGVDIDFISNRITGVDKNFGASTVLHFAGWDFIRMNSLAGEASMFAFSILPFTVLLYYLKDKLYIVLLIALLMSTSTTAFVGLALFTLLEVVLRRSFRFLGLMTAILAVIAIMNWDLVMDLYRFSAGKFAMEHVSGIERLHYFSGCMNLFADSNIFHQLFGYGFGYVRSTDGFSTMLVNVGVVGMACYCIFFLYPVLAYKATSDYLVGLRVAVIVLQAAILASVPEFYTFHVWFFAGLAWYEYLKQRPIFPLPRALHHHRTA